jgi:hypothetical protein
MEITESYKFDQMYGEMLKKPVLSVWESKGFAAIFALATTFIIEVQVAFFELTHVDIKLVVGLVILIFLDLFFGMWSAKVQRGEKIQAIKIRQTGIKIIEYTGVCLAFVILSNMAGEFDWIKTMAFTFLAGVEIKSILEKMVDEKGILKDLVDMIVDRVQKKGK